MTGFSTGGHLATGSLHQTPHTCQSPSGSFPERKGKGCMAIAVLQWNLQIKDTLGCREVVFSRRGGSILHSRPIRPSDGSTYHIIC